MTRAEKCQEASVFLAQNQQAAFMERKPRTVTFDFRIGDEIVDTMSFYIDELGNSREMPRARKYGGPRYLIEPQSK